MKKLGAGMVIFAFLLISTTAFADIKTFTQPVKQPFKKGQSPDKARIAAVAEAKHEVLERAVSYVESLNIAKEGMPGTYEMTALIAGVLKAEIVSQKEYRTKDALGTMVVVEVEVDTNILEKRVNKFLEYRALLKRNQKSLRHEKRLLAKIERLEEKNQKAGGFSQKQHPDLYATYIINGRFVQTSNKKIVAFPGLTGNEIQAVDTADSKRQDFAAF